MAKKGGVKANLEKLQALYEALALKPVVQVGVFETKSGRKSAGDSPSNADVASAHEFGLPKNGVPARSILRIPISGHAKQIMGAVTAGAEKLLVSKDGIKLMYRNVGLAAEKVIQRAFDTGGFGKWPQLKYETLLRKLNKGRNRPIQIRRQKAAAQLYEGASHSAILVDTAQLRRSFSSRVVYK